MSDPDRLATAERTVLYFGLKPKFGRNVRKRSGYLGGLGGGASRGSCTRCFPIPDVRGVFCIRGGYGSGQLLDRIDYDLIRRNPEGLPRL